MKNNPIYHTNTQGNRYEAQPVPVFLVEWTRL